MTPRRSTGTIETARALWYTAAGKAALRPEQLGALAEGHARVRTAYSAISRGTERLVFSGQVGQSEWDRMRAPLQGGRFPFPIKYGYCAVGTVERGPDDLVGKTVFSLHPHQDLFDAPIGMLAVVPPHVPARRATLAANAETALNALWDAAAGPGDRIAVVGAGIVGLMVTSIAARLPGATVTVVDLDASRRPLVEAMGAHFALPADAAALTGEADIVVHTSVSAAGLNAAIDLAGMEGTIIELSWYGDKPVALNLGGPFHSKRLKLISSQVGQVSPGHRSRWSYARRMEAALRLLDHPALDALVADDIAFADTPKLMPALLGPTAQGLAPLIRYG